MKLRYLGTAAAEALPSPFCKCDICNKARALGGKNYRSRSQAVLDDTLLLDFPADTLYHAWNNQLDFVKIRHCLITHTHGDHLYPEEITNLFPWFAHIPEGTPPFVFYGSAEVGKIIQPVIQNNPDRVQFVTLRPFESVAIDGYEVTPLKATHGTGEPFIYLISRNGQSMLYAHDTGLLCQEDRAYLKSIKLHLDFVSMDCTEGHRDIDYDAHMNVKANLAFREMLFDCGVADEETRFCLNHFSHNGGFVLYDDMVNIAEPLGFSVSYDGREVDFGKSTDFSKFSNDFIPHDTRIDALCQARFADTETEYRDGDLVPCRDPFILPYHGKYYLYQTGKEKGILCRVSDNLKAWSAPITVFETPQDFHGIDNFYWAPECHYYKGRFYLFTSVKSEKNTDHRTISVYRADNPLGPFVDIADGRLSPEGWDAIDGTLYSDKNQQPWLVFVHEWTSTENNIGDMVAAKLSPDLSKLISEPILLFSAKDPDWNAGCITDGPFLYRTENGTLLMTWSNGSDHGYVVAGAESDNGEIDGHWSQSGLLYQQGLTPGMTIEGGHGMFFRTEAGEIRFVLHTPNYAEGDTFEHVTYLSVREEGNSVSLLPITE